jgi:hypothetical protein
MNYTKQLNLSSVLVVSLATIALLLVPTLTFAAAPETTDGFVCPVFNDGSAAGEHNPNAVQIGGGDYTVIGPNVSVPIHATNGNGAGSPGGDHSTPGDSDYTAIWSGQ